MRLFPSLVGSVGLALLVSGLLLATLGVDSQPVALDLRKPSTTAAGEDRTPVTPLDAALWVKPWVVPRPPVVVAPPVTEAPAAPLPAPVVVKPTPNGTALSFLGKVVKDDQTIVYFFKEKANGLVVGLSLGQTKNGWTLGQVDETGYHLEGPGGAYEVRP